LDCGKITEQLNIILTNAWYIHHNYGIQGLNIPVIDKLKKYFNDVNFSIIINKKVSIEDIHFAQEHNIHIIEYPGIVSIPKSSNFFDKEILYKARYVLNQKRYLKNDNKLITVRNNFVNSVKKGNVIIDTTGIEYIGNKPIKSKWGNYANASFFQYLAKDYDIPYIKNTKSFGPFVGRLYTRQVRDRLNQLPFLFVRGRYNLEDVKKLKLKIPIHSFPDVSLSMKPEPESWAKSYLAEQGIVFSESVIGISPSAVIKGIPENPNNICGTKHLLLCKKVIDYFQKEGKQIIIIPHSIHDGVSEKTCDLAVSIKIFNSLKDTHNVFLLDDMNLTYKQVRAIIGLLDFYITGRYHSVCSALYMGVPTVCFAWHIKYKDVLSMFLDEYPIINCRKDSIKDGMNLILKYYNDRSWFDKDDVLKRRKEVNVQIDRSIELIVEEINRKLDI